MISSDVKVDFGCVRIFGLHIKFVEDREFVVMIEPLTQRHMSLWFM